MIAQGYLSNQGDAWEWTQNNRERALRDELADAVSEQEQHYNALGELKDFAGMLGQRLGEMHEVLAQTTDDPDFAPQATKPKDAQPLGKDEAAPVENDRKSDVSDKSVPPRVDLGGRRCSKKKIKQQSVHEDKETK